MAKFLSNMAVVAISTTLLAIPLYLWRIFYPLTDWAALLLAPLAFMLFVGFREPLAAMLRARSLATLRADSWLSPFMTGRIKAAILSSIFVAVTVPILAWQALDATHWTTLALVALCMAASSMALGAQRWLQHHLHGPYAAWHGHALGAGVAALIFVPILAWINWTHTIYPGEFLSLNLREAILFGITEQLPSRRGWIAQFLALLYALESMQIWLVARLGTSVFWVPVLYSLYTAMIAFVVARASVAVACFTQYAIRNTEMNRNSSNR